WEILHAQATVPLYGPLRGADRRRGRPGIDPAARRGPRRRRGDRPGLVLYGRGLLPGRFVLPGRERRGPRGVLPRPLLFGGPGHQGQRNREDIVLLRRALPRR